MKPTISVQYLDGHVFAQILDRYAGVWDSMTREERRERIGKMDVTAGTSPFPIPWVPVELSADIGGEFGRENTSRVVVSRDKVQLMRDFLAEAHARNLLPGLSELTGASDRTMYHFDERLHIEASDHSSGTPPIPHAKVTVSTADFELYGILPKSGFVSEDKYYIFLSQDDRAYCGVFFPTQFAADTDQKRVHVQFAGVYEMFNSPIIPTTIQEASVLNSPAVPTTVQEASVQPPRKPFIERLKQRLSGTASEATATQVTEELWGPSAQLQMKVDSAILEAGGDPFTDDSSDVLFAAALDQLVSYPDEMTLVGDINWGEVADQELYHVFDQSIDPIADIEQMSRPELMSRLTRAGVVSIDVDESVERYGKTLHAATSNSEHESIAMPDLYEIDEEDQSDPSEIHVAGLDDALNLMDLTDTDSLIYDMNTNRWTPQF